MANDPAVSPRTTYQSRSVRPLGIWEHSGWRLKVYGVTEGGEYPRSIAVEAARRAAADVLPQPATDGHRYGIGFLGVHDAASGCYTFVDWWEHENELHHRPFAAPAARPEEFEPVSEEGSSACTWDLAVMGFERDAWVTEVLANPHGPAIDRYMASWLTGDV
jgi:hypothetical protein